MRVITALVLVVALAAAAARLASADVTILTDCVDTDKVANLNKQISDHGGAADNTVAVCKGSGGTGIFRGHTSIVHHKQSPLGRKGCHQLDPTSTQFTAQGCKIFSTVSAANKATETAIKAWLQSAEFVPTAAMKDTEAFRVLIDHNILLSDVTFLQQSGHLGSGQMKELNRRRAGATSMTTAAFFQAGLANADVVRALKVYPNAILQGLSSVAMTVTRAEPYASATSARAGFAAMAKSACKPDKWLETEATGSAGAAAKTILKNWKSNLGKKLEAMIKGDVPAYTNFYATHLSTAASVKALKCVPVIHEQVGLNFGKLHNDVANGCSKTSKTYTMRPACSRLAVAQLLHWNRMKSLDTAAPWHLYGGNGSWGSRHTAIKMNTANALAKAYKKDGVYNKCVSNVRVHGKTGAKDVICQAFTECHHNVIWHVSEAYTGCKVTVHDTTEDDTNEQIGMTNVIDSSAPTTTGLVDQQRF